MKEVESDEQKMVKQPPVERDSDEKYFDDRRQSARFGTMFEEHALKEDSEDRADRQIFSEDISKEEEEIKDSNEQVNQQNQITPNKHSNETIEEEKHEDENIS